MTTPPLRACLIGCGQIGRAHLEAMAARDDVRLLTIVDPEVDREQMGLPVDVRVVADLRDGGDEAIDLFVVATPSDTHARVAIDALRTSSSALVLVEKPLVTDLDDLSAVRHAAGPGVGRVRAAHHFMFSPEVRWAADWLGAAGWGPAERVTCTSFDPYVDALPARHASLTSSWLDSGVNQLSVLTRFLDLDQLVPVDHVDEGVGSWTALRSATTEVLLVTDWRAAGSSKRTELRWPDGATVVLDHTAMACTVVQDGRVVDACRVSSATPRSTVHYRALYDVLVTDPAHQDLSLDTAERIMRLLHHEATR